MNTIKGTRALVVSVLCIVATSLGLSPVASAQEIPGLPERNEEVQPSDPTSVGEIAARRAAVSRELEKIEAAIVVADPVDLAHLEVVRSRLRRIESLLAELASFAVTVSKAGSEEPTTGSTAPSAFALNALLEAQFANESHAARRADALSSSRVALTAAKENLDTAERRRRKARREVEQSGDGDPERLRRVLQLRQLDARIAQEEVYLRTVETRAAQHDRNSTLAETDLAPRIRAMRERLRQREGDSSAGFAALAQRMEEARRSRQAASRREAAIELHLNAAATRLATDGTASRELFEEVDALTARRDSVRNEIALMDARLDRLEQQRRIWDQWQNLLEGSVDREEFESLARAAHERVAALKQAEAQLEWRMSDVKRRREAIEVRLSELPDTSPLRHVIEGQADALLQLHHAGTQEIVALSADRRVVERLLEDLRGPGLRMAPMDILRVAIRGAREAWAYEITSVDDAPITVGSLVIALVLFGAGMWTSRLGSASVGRVVQERFKLDPGAAHAIEKLSFYALLIGISLLALRVVHFPLTAFTVLGGALAIGVGFGSQNVMNNFISGLILMLERPVRARDVVEVDGNHGTIEHIGARSTQIRSTDGRHIIVPNSFFLESNVVNWTLSDDLVRAKVSVGVNYGSPTRLVEQLIARVVADEDRILDDPGPIIVFNEFGDNALNFDVYFWVKARSPMEMRKVESRVRFAIDDVFREHELVIAFPQRDVHLDTATPLEVRMVDKDDDPQTES